MGSAICQNYADSKLKQQAEQRGIKAVADALESQHKKYIDDLTEKFEGKNGVLPKLSEQANELKAAESLITSKSTETIGQLTGSESYAVLMYAPGIQQFLAFSHVGKYPLYGVSARIADLEQPQTVFTFPPGVPVAIGDMIRSHGYVEPIPEGIPTSNILFTARNGNWIEALRVVRVNDGVARAIRVMGLFTLLKKEKLMCETIDPKFPRDTKAFDFKPIPGQSHPPVCEYPLYCAVPADSVESNWLSNPHRGRCCKTSVSLYR